MKLLDEFGVTWQVSAGDPANGLVNKLKAKGFTIIYLTRYTYRNGLLDDPMPKRGEDIIGWTRLHDCRKVLKGD